VTENAVPLREYLQRQLDDLQRLLDDRYATQTKAIDKAFDAQQLAMRTAMDAAERAVQTAMQAEARATTKAEVAADKRFELLNELRGDVATRAEVEALEKLVNGLTSRFDKTEGRGAGLASGYQILIGLVATALAVYLALKGH
jgi:hypothetical protein